jgi:hypothetical protein
VAWSERDHPRDDEGRFADRWVGRVSDAIAATRGLAVAEHPDDFQAEYVPGRWLVEDRDLQLKDQERQVWQFIEGTDLRTKHSQAELEDMVREQAELVVPPNPGLKLRNGPHQIYWNADSAASRDDIAFIARRVDELQAQHPVEGNISISIVPQRNMVGVNEGKAWGQTQRGTARIFLSEEIFRPGAQQEDPGFMPSYKDRGVVDYTLTHEWGHAHDRHENSESIRQWGEGMEGISEYGIFSPREAYAEAFAEWALTGGKTTNESARHYARENGWK